MPPRSSAPPRWLRALPDALSLSRIGLAFSLIFAWQSKRAVIAIAIVAGVTDVLDGWAARWVRSREQKERAASSHGDWLDPLCDKIFVVSWLAATWALMRPPWQMVALLSMRELLLLVGMLAHALVIPGRPIKFRANRLGKLTTCLQFAAILSLLAEARSLAMVLAAAAAVAGMAAAIGYVLASWKLRDAAYS